MTSFFKKKNQHNQRVSSSPNFDSPPMASLPTPPTSHINKLKVFNRISSNPTLNGNNNHNNHNLNSSVSMNNMNNNSNNHYNDAFTNITHSTNNKNNVKHFEKSQPQQPITNSSQYKSASYNEKSNKESDNSLLLHENTETPRSTAASIINVNQMTTDDNNTSYLATSTPWSKRKLYNSPFPRFGHAVSSLTSNSGASYLMGGLSGNDVYGDMWVIEPIRKTANNGDNNYNTSSYIASPIENPQKVPSPRTGHASILIGNAFIIFSGDTAIDYEQALDNKLYFFNISSLKWTITSPTGPKPCGRYGHQISVLNFELSPNKWSSQLYVFGGQLNDQYFNDLWRFDLSKFKDPNNQWVNIKTSGDIPLPLSNYTMTAYNDKLFIYGGTNGSSVSDKLYSYNALTNEWSICSLKGPVIPPGLYGHSSTIFGSLLFIYGGRLSNDLNSGELYVIDVSSFKCWKLKSNLPYSPGPRYGHSITVNPTDQKLIIMGGDVYDNDFNGTEEDSSIGLIDEAKFSLLSSVIYECDIKQIEKFLEATTTIKSTRNVSNSSKNSTSPVSTSGSKNSVLPSAYGQDLVEKRYSNIDLSDDSPSTPPEMSTSNDIGRELSVKTYDSSLPIVSSTPIQTTDDDASESLYEDDQRIQKIKIDTPNGKSLINNLISNVSPSKPRNEEYSTSASTENTDTMKTETTIATNSPTDTAVDPIIYRTPESNNGDRIGKIQPLSSMSSISSKQRNAGLPSNDNKTLKDNESNNTPNSYQDFATPSIQQQSSINGATVPFSPAVVERDNMKLQKLVQIVSDVKAEMKVSVAQANDQIVALEMEKKELIEQLKKKDTDKTTTSQSISTSTLVKKNQEMENFITNELSSISDLNSLLKEQKKQIDALSTKLEEEESLKEKIFNLQAENSTLKNKLENLSTYDLIAANKTRSLQEKSLKKVSYVDSLTSKLDSLLLKWEESGPQNKGSIDDMEELQERNMTLARQLDESSSKFKEFEVLYNESKNSLNKSHKALLLSQSEINKLKEHISLLTKQLDDLKLSKRNFSNSSSRKTSSSRGYNASALSKSESIDSLNDSTHHSDLTDSNISGHQDSKKSGSQSNEDSEEETENDMNLIDDRYEIKIKDLEANLFIVSQERDQMRAELIQLKKKMYNSRNNTSFISSPTQN